MIGHNVNLQFKSIVYWSIAKPEKTPTNQVELRVRSRVRIEFYCIFLLHPTAPYGPTSNPTALRRAVGNSTLRLILSLRVVFTLRPYA